MQPIQVAEFLRAEQRARGLDGKQFAKLTATLNQSSCAAILRGNASPRLSTLERIFDALGYDLEIQAIKRVRNTETNPTMPFSDL